VALKDIGPSQISSTMFMGGAASNKTCFMGRCIYWSLFTYYVDI